MRSRKKLPRAWDVDVYIYGATVGGIFAAIAAKKAGKTVLITEQHSYHIGGMVTGGISYVDSTTTPSDLMPLALDFYTRLATHYGQTIAVYMNPEPKTEPKTAMLYLRQMMAENGITVVHSLRIKSVNKSGVYIRDVILTDGSVVRASRYVDASYEGDLIRYSGISYTVGREANATYGETYNGGTALLDTKTGYPIDPYVTAGVPGSGLLPNVLSTITAVGAADNRVSGYNYRLCMTKAANRIPVPQPTTYNAMDYERIGRLWAAGYTGAIFTASVTQNGKYDFNANGAAGTNIFTETHDYPEANYTARDAFAARLKQYTLGLFKFIAEDSRCPAATRTDTATYGFPADEFLESGGFPPQVYVREARRMVGDYVFTEVDINNDRPVDGIANYGYPFDSHYVSLVDSAGVLKTEGQFFVNIGKKCFAPYRTLLPKVSECKNLGATFCVSASHVGFGTLRMEYVSMGLGEALGHAASLSIDKKIDMPDLNASYIQAKMGINPIGVIMQALNATGNGVVTTVGAWTTSINQEGAIIYDKDFVHDNAAGKGTKSIRFTPSASLINAGSYEISVKHKYVNDASRATNIPLAIQRSGGITNITMSQRFAGTLTNQFQSLGTYTLVGDGSDYVEISTTGTAAGTYIVVDAICFSPVSGVV